MLTTYGALLTKKLEFLLNRTLTATERKYFLRKIKTGNRQEIKDAAAHLNIANSFVPISSIIKQYSLHQDLSRLSKEALVHIVEDVVVKTTSVRAGLSILRKAGSMSKEVLLQYVYDLYLKDATDRERRPHKYANREAITNDQANRPPTVENQYGIFSFENTDKNNSLTDVKTYDSKGDYLADEFKQTPDHNGPKKPGTIKEQLKQYFRVPTVKPTGGYEDGGANQKT